MREVWTKRKIATTHEHDLLPGRHRYSRTYAVDIRMRSGELSRPMYEMRI
jgi:hypothetical protein